MSTFLPVLHSGSYSFKCLEDHQSFLQYFHEDVDQQVDGRPDALLTTRGIQPVAALGQFVSGRTECSLHLTFDDLPDATASGVRVTHRLLKGEVPFRVCGKMILEQLFCATSWSTFNVEPIFL